MTLSHAINILNDAKWRGFDDWKEHCGRVVSANWASTMDGLQVQEAVWIAEGISREPPTKQESE